MTRRENIAVTEEQRETLVAMTIRLTRLLSDRKLSVEVCTSLSVAIWISQVMVSVAIASTAC